MQELHPCYANVWTKYTFWSFLATNPNMLWLQTWFYFLPQGLLMLKKADCQHKFWVGSIWNYEYVPPAKRRLCYLASGTAVAAANTRVGKEDQKQRAVSISKHQGTRWCTPSYFRVTYVGKSYSESVRVYSYRSHAVNTHLIIVLSSFSFVHFLYILFACTEGHDWIVMVTVLY